MAGIVRGDTEGTETLSDRESSGGQPSGDVYDWYRRALTLLDGGSPEAAAALLTHARSEEPTSASVLEALARATFDARRYADAAAHFSEPAATSPDNDYAWFGLGLERMRLGQHAAAVEHLAMAVAMRPGRDDYRQALREARATVRALEQSA